MMVAICTALRPPGALTLLCDCGAQAIASAGSSGGSAVAKALASAYASGGLSAFPGNSTSAAVWWAHQHACLIIMHDA